MGDLQQGLEAAIVGFEEAFNRQDLDAAEAVIREWCTADVLFDNSRILPDVRPTRGATEYREYLEDIFTQWEQIRSRGIGEPVWVGERLVRETRVTGTPPKGGLPTTFTIVT